MQTRDYISRPATTSYARRGIVDRTFAKQLIHNNVLTAPEAGALYHAFLDEVWAWTPDAEPLRVAVYQVLRTLMESGLTNRQRRDLQVYVRCPECRAIDFAVRPTGMHECECGAEWRPKSLRTQRNERELAAAMAKEFGV